MYKEVQETASIIYYHPGCPEDFLRLACIIYTPSIMEKTLSKRERADLESHLWVGLLKEYEKIARVEREEFGGNCKKASEDLYVKRLKKRVEDLFILIDQQKALVNTLHSRILPQ